MEALKEKHVVHSMSGGLDSLRNLLYLVYHRVPVIHCVYVSVINCNSVKKRKELQSIDRILERVNKYIQNEKQNTTIVFSHHELPAPTYVGNPHLQWIGLGLAEHINDNTVAISFGAERGSMMIGGGEHKLFQAGLKESQIHLPILTPFNDCSKDWYLPTYHEFLPFLSTCESFTEVRYCRSCEKCYEAARTVTSYLTKNGYDVIITEGIRNIKFHSLVRLLRKKIKDNEFTWRDTMSTLEINYTSTTTKCLNDLFEGTLS